MALRPGTRIGPYEIVGLLGVGGMGEVYKGHDPRLGRDVAVKVLPGEFADNPDRLRRFEQEARAAAALNHPNIVAIYDVGSEGSVPYLVSELLEGQTLREALSAGQIAFDRIVDVARQVASGLSAAHARGIAHRDLKPENIFLTADGHAKILDFGVAKWTPPAHGRTQTTMNWSGATEAGTVLGTIGYMAPEQATGKPTDFRCDQFAFGIVVFEMLSGRRAFQRPSQVEEIAAILRDDPPPLMDVRPEAPLPLQWVLNRCLAKDPAERYASTQDLHRELETLAVQAAEAPAPASRPSVPAASTLPAPRTSLVGRETDVAKAKQVVLRDAVRLVTLTGPGGIGKSRLALQVAHELKEQFAGGVYFAPLSTIADASLVPQIVAHAFGVRQTSQSPIEGLRSHLASKLSRAPALLLLDSFEHLLAAVPFIVDLLQIDAPLKVVVTSRQSLRLYEENEVPVLPLPRPDPAKATALEALAMNAAVKLFVERAAASKPDFALTSENARAIAEICYRLDGLPLAIELAAARVKALPPAAMLGRLESRLQILTGGARDLPERQQTLRGAIAWSHDLLDEAEQRLFRRISVFVGGCTFEAAEAVADTKRDLGVDIIDGIESLVNKSMIQLGDQLDSEVRVTIMETVREYGLERLTQSGEDAHVRKAHAAYFLVLAEEAAAALEGPDQPIWLERLDRDRDNVRAALEWLRATGNAAWGLRLASALLRYWEVRELFAEGRRWLSAMLAVPAAKSSTAARAKAAFSAAVLASGQRDYRGQEPFLVESERIYRELGDRRGAAIVLNAKAVGRKNDGDPARAREVFEEALALWVELDDGTMRARTLSNLATVLKETGEVDEALARHEESQALFEQLGDEVGVAWELRHQGDITRDRHDRARAESFYQRSLAAFQAMGDAWSTGSLLIDLGNLALSVGEVERGVDYFHQAAEAFQHLGGHKRGMARVLEGLAVAASLQGDAARAIRLAGAAAALRAASGTTLTTTEQRLVTTGLEPANAALSADERSKAWTEGWSMAPERAVAYGTGTAE